MGFRNQAGLSLVRALAALGIVGCGVGRIPPLYDAPIQLPKGSDSGLPVPDAAPDSPDTMASCTGIVVSTATRELGDVLLVLDRSGSMSFSISEECSCDPMANPAVVCKETTVCTTRWTSLVTALDTTLSSTPSLFWGLKLFSSPNAGPCEVERGVEVPIGADVSAIESRIAATTPAGETPTAAAIITATAYLKTLTDTHSKRILLATDGKPNCGGVPPSVYVDDVPGTSDAITAAFDEGFLVYVIGMGSSVTVANLDAFAQAGGTGRAYSGQSPDDLSSALSSISKAASCSFALDTAPPNPDWVAVYLDNKLVPRDENNGWGFGASSRTILLHGSFCEQALADSGPVVKALFGCGEPAPTSLP